MRIPFSKMTVVGNEEKYLLEALHSSKWSGRGPKTQALEKLTQQKLHTKHAFFVTSGSAALEVGTLLASLKPGDEVITPSFAFVSSANAIVMRGAKPVFADIDKDLWNMTAKTVEPLITKKTRAILPIYYNGSAAGSKELTDICKREKFFLIEDACQGLGATRDKKPLGGTDFAACFSLHDTKNAGSGEGGLVTTDSDDLAKRIEIIIEKGTNRQQFFRGQVDKYRWVDLGSSYIASDMLAAVALAQMEGLEKITAKRQKICKTLRDGLSKFDGKISWQKIPDNMETNGHVCAFVIDPGVRDKVLAHLNEVGVQALFHYVPLHDSPYAQEHGFAPRSDLVNTRHVSEGLVRLPVFYSMTDAEVDFVISTTSNVLAKI